MQRLVLGGDAALHVDEILQCDGNAVKRPHRMSGVDGPVGCIGRFACIVREDVDERVQLGVVACDALEI